MPSRRPTVRLAACLVATLPLASALSARACRADQMGAGRMEMPADTTGNPADKAFAGAMEDMMAAMEHVPPTGDTDEDFVRMMMPHHQAAIAMAKTELTHGRDPELKAMADAIVASQGQELAAMKAWLAKHAGERADGRVK